MRSLVVILMVSALSAQQALSLEVRCGTALRPAKYTIEDGAQYATAVSDYILKFPADDPVMMPIYERSNDLVVLGNGDPRIQLHIILSPVPKMDIYSDGKLFQTDPCEIIIR